MTNHYTSAHKKYNKRTHRTVYFGFNTSLPAVIGERYRYGAPPMVARLPIGATLIFERLCRYGTASNIDKSVKILTHWSSKFQETERNNNLVAQI